MSYDTEKLTLGRKPVWIIEIDLDYCDLTYGSAPCTAAIGVTGPAKCFNTSKTCQDRDNYTRGTRTYRFSSVILPPSGDLQFQAIPCVRDVSMLPSLIEPGKGIGQRSVLTVTLKDFAHSDLGIDKYLADRSYDSEAQGTYFAKLMARNPYYQGRSLRVLTGYVVDGQEPNIDNFITRLYRIEKIDGPMRDGTFKITAKDPLKALDADRSQAPTPSNGKLLASLNNSDGIFALTPSGVGAEYPASGVVRLEEELMSYTISGDVMTVSRGIKNTEAVSHDADVAVQLCLNYSAVPLTQVVQDLLQNYAGIDLSLLDITGWNTEADLWLNEYDLTATVTKPTGVVKLIEELCQQCQMFIWWDERDQLVKLKAVRPWAFDEIANVNDSDNIIADSISIKDDPARRVSRVLVYYGQKNPVEDLDKVWNYSRANVRLDSDAESDDEYGESRISVIYSRWLNSSQTSLAIKLASRLLNRYRNNPRKIMLKLDAKDSEAWLGETILCTTRGIVDYDGSPLPTYLQVVGVRETVNGSEYEYTLEDTQFTGRYCLWAPEGLPDYPLASDALRGRYGWYADNAGNLSTGASGYLYA